MRIAATAAALALALVPAGCGDDDEDDQSQAPSAAAVELTKRCGGPAPESGSPPEALLPDGILPDDAAVTRWEGEERATVLLDGSVNDAYKALIASAEKAGYEIEFREVEVFDAEVEVKTDDGVIRFALEPAPDCDDVTRAVATRQRV